MAFNESTAPAKGQFLVYQAEDGKLKIDVRFEDESVWLTQQHMAELFQSSKQNISHHINSVYEEGELAPEATVKKYLTVRKEGNREVKRQLDYYNLDMIMQDWTNKLDAFLSINDRDILNHAGKISHKLAKQQAAFEYDKFHTQRIQQADDALNSLEQVIEQQQLTNKKGNNDASA